LENLARFFTHYVGSEGQQKTYPGGCLDMFWKKENAEERIILDGILANLNSFLNVVIKTLRSFT
jgi:hypothetical protein